MNKGFLKFSVLKNYEDEEGLLHLSLTGGSEEWVSSIKFYGNPAFFKEIGNKLEKFPNEKEVIFEVGKRRDDPELGNRNWYSYLYLRFYCYDSLGHVAVDVIMNNNQENSPLKKTVEFSILSEIASINELGRKLINWNLLEENELVWETETPTNYIN